MTSLCRERIGTKAKLQQTSEELGMGVGSFVAKE